MFRLFGSKFGSTLNELKHEGTFISLKQPGPFWQGLVQWPKDIGRMCLTPSLSLTSLWVGFTIKQDISLHGRPLQYYSYSLPVKNLAEIRTHLPLYFQQMSQNHVTLACLRHMIISELIMVAQGMDHSHRPGLGYVCELAVKGGINHLNQGWRRNAPRPTAPSPPRQGGTGMLLPGGKVED